MAAICASVFQGVYSTGFLIGISLNHHQCISIISSTTIDYRSILSATLSATLSDI